MTVTGRPERARVARAFVGAVLGPGHPCGDDVVLLVSELFGNSVRHGGSGAPREMVTVAVRVGTALSGLRSPTEVDPGYRGCAPLAGMRKAAVGFSSSRGLRRGGGGGGAAGGW